MGNNMKNIEAFFHTLWRNKFRVIYLAHYEDVELARLLARALEKNGFKVTVAEDARRYGKDFVGKKIGESDLILVLNPDSNASALIVNIGSNIIDIDIKSLRKYLAS